MLQQLMGYTSNIKNTVTEADLVINTKVKDSPVGPGIITGHSLRGTPKVNGVGVAWLVLEDGQKWDFKP